VNTDHTFILNHADVGEFNFHLKGTGRSLKFWSIFKQPCTAERHVKLSHPLLIIITLYYYYLGKTFVTYYWLIRNLKWHRSLFHVVGVKGKDPLHFVRWFIFVLRTCFASVVNKYRSIDFLQLIARKIRDCPIDFVQF
jgi:hypothetical protein